MKPSEGSDYEKGDRVEVKLKGAKNDFTFKAGKVTQLNGNGAYVRLDEGNSNFFYFNQIRHEGDVPPVRKKPAEPLARIGDVVDLKSKMVKPPEPAPPPNVQEASPPSEPLPGEIGALFAEWRRREGRTQKWIANQIGLQHQADVSGIERGERLLTDDALLRFAEVSKIDVAVLERARDAAKLRISKERVAKISEELGVGAPAPQKSAELDLKCLPDAELEDLIGRCTVEQQRRRALSGLADEVREKAKALGLSPEMLADLLRRA